MSLLGGSTNDEDQRSRWLVRRTASLTSELRWPCHDVTPWCSKQQSARCETTLSIGPSPLREGPVPTRRLYPTARGLNAFGEICSSCFNLSSCPTSIRADSISIPEPRRFAYSLTNVTDCGSPASVPMAPRQCGVPLPSPRRGSSGCTSTSLPSFPRGHY